MDAKTPEHELAPQSGFQPAPQEEESSFNEKQDSALRMLANSLHRMNEAIVKAADAGLTIELMRASRYHSGFGSWGDQMMPIVKKHDS